MPPLFLCAKVFPSSFLKMLIDNLFLVLVDLSGISLPISLSLLWNYEDACWLPTAVECAEQSEE